MNPLKQHLKNLPSGLVDALQVEFQKIHEQYFLGRWEPSQLDSGRFAEATLRIIEQKDTGHFTAVGVQLNRVAIVQSAERNTVLADSLRFQIPRLAGLILDFRNNRNVGHLGSIDVNGMDATFVLHSANWIVAELIRLETQMNPEEAQSEIKKIIERQVPIIEDLGGRLKILDPKLSVQDKILAICFQKFPEHIQDKDLLSWTEYDPRHSSRFYQYLKQLSRDSLVDYRNGKVILTKRGILWVEKNIKFELEL